MLLNRLNLSSTMPGVLAPQVQNVDFEKYIGAKKRIGSIADEMLYITTINNINSETSVGQQWNQDLNKQSYSLGQVALPYYTIQAYNEYNPNEMAKFEKTIPGVSLPNFLENLAKQGINQRKHAALIVGFDDGLSQGILSNSTLTTLPDDSAGISTIVGYNVAELQQFLATQARQVMDASFGMLKPVILASSVRIINYLKTAVVGFMDSASPAGVDSVAGLYQRIIGQWLGVGSVEFIADDIFKDMDLAGNDGIVFVAPGIESLDKLPDDVSQNLVGYENSIPYNTMYNTFGLMKFVNPPYLGDISEKFVYKMTPGANLRQEAVRVVSCKFQTT